MALVLFPISPIALLQNFVLSKAAQCGPGCWVRKNQDYHYRAHQRTKPSLSNQENFPLSFSPSCQNDAMIVPCTGDPPGQQECTG